VQYQQCEDNPDARLGSKYAVESVVVVVGIDDIVGGGAVVVEFVKDIIEFVGSEVE
jgi:hypothetical protein